MIEIMYQISDVRYWESMFNNYERTRDKCEIVIPSGARNLVCEILYELHDCVHYFQESRSVDSSLRSE